MGVLGYTSLCTKINSFLNFLGAATCLYMFYLGPVTGVLMTIVLIFSPFCPLMILYLIWIYIDRETPHSNGRRLPWVRRLGIFKRFRDYFPQTIIKTSELPSSENYMLCIFPHGILCTSGLCNFSSDITGFATLFPNLTISCHTLNLNFYFPFSREYLLSIGFFSVSKKAILHQLCKEKKGNAVAIVVGGSAEAMVSSPGTHRVILKNRKGFIKLALTTGTNLVPIYSFGETDLYKQYIFKNDSIIHRIQQAIRKFTGVAPVLFNGCGFFQSYFGIMPYPKPVHMIVGKPIKVEQNKQPTQNDIDTLHNIFIQELTNHFDEHKHKYVKDPENTHLIIDS